jgi:YhcH/YjgK/YiaL family protein
MIYGNLRSLDTYSALLVDAVWREAFGWLRELPPRAACGTYALRGEEMFARVMEYDTLPREECAFESHRRYIDLQCTIAGGELIEWRCSGELEPAGPYDAETDVQFYRLAPAMTRMHQLPGHFAIFYPSDAHMPKVSDGVHPNVFKAVIKVGIRLLGSTHSLADRAPGGC